MSLFISRIPFFFEPNFDAHIKPLAAARRIQDGGTDIKTDSDVDSRSVVYGDFLMKKVGGNFAKGRYDN